jgi:hypothetical protein
VIKDPFARVPSKARGNSSSRKERFCLPYRVNLSAGVERVTNARAYQVPDGDVLRETVTRCKVRAMPEHRRTCSGKSKGERET